jgi:hypothetical protein
VKYRSPLAERLAWPGRFGRRAPDPAARIQLVHRAFVARWAGSARITLLSMRGWIPLAWPALSMEFVAALWQASAPGDHAGDARVGAGMVSWKVVERDVISVPAVSTERWRDVPISDGDRTERLSAAGAPGDVRVSERMITLRTVLERQVVRVPARRTEQPRVGRQLDHLRWSTRHAIQVSPRPPSLRPAAPKNVETGHRLHATPVLLRSARGVRREVLPAFAMPDTGSRTPSVLSPADASAMPATSETASLAATSLIDQLFSRAERSAPLDALTFRVLPTQAPSPARAPEAREASTPEEGRARQWHAVKPGPTPTSGVHSHFSRADIELLADKLLKVIKRQERLERESKGIL